MLMILSVIFILSSWCMDFGIDQLHGQNVHEKLKNKKIAVLAHSASVNKNGQHLIDLLYPQFQLIKIFAPEHGLRSTQDDWVDDDIDEQTQLPVVSLYKKSSRAPTLADLENIDLVVIDLQDIGTRFYTYFSTIAEFIKVAAHKKIEIILLDRPNPLGGHDVFGFSLDVKLSHHFISYLPHLPTQHGLTIGELTNYFLIKNKIDIPFTVVKIKNWQRENLIDSWDREWIPSSPAITEISQAYDYAYTGVLEQFNLSVGRSLDNKKAFKKFAAPWINEDQSIQLKEKLDQLSFKNINFEPICYISERSIYINQKVCGVQIHFLDFYFSTRPDEFSYKVSQLLLSSFKEHIQFSQFAPNYFGSNEMVMAIKNQVPWKEFQPQIDQKIKQFKIVREEFLLY